MARVVIVLWRLRRIRRAGLPWSEVRAQTQAVAFARRIEAIFQREYRLCSTIGSGVAARDSA